MPLLFLHRPGLGTTRTGLSPLKAALAAAAADFNVLCFGDSRINAQDESAFQFFAQTVAPQNKAWTVQARFWNDATPAYDAPITVQTGTGSRTMTAWMGAVAGAGPGYLMGAKKAAAIDATNANLILDFQGANVLGSNLRGEFLMGMEPLKLQFPSANYVHVLPYPYRDDSTMAATAAAKTLLAQQYGDSLIDWYSPPVVAGNYADNIHWDTDGTGNIGVPFLTYAYNGSDAGAMSPSAAFLSVTAASLLSNWDFASFTPPSPPTGWTASTPTFTKDLVIHDTGQTYSVQLDAATAGYMVQTLSAAALVAAKAAGYVTVAAREYLEVGAATTVGRLQSHPDDGGDVITRAATIGIGGFVWNILIGPVGPTTTIEQLVAYCNTAAGASTARYGSINMVAGQFPRTAV